VSRDEMKKNELTTKQRDLVDTIVTTGKSIKECSQIVGYAKGESGRVIASRTLRLPHVQKYMIERVANTIGLGAVSASRRLVELSSDAKSEYVQLEASRDILDRAGIRAPERVQHHVAGDIKINIDLS
jgi:phage terminase small subunit|tara:strand:+ start:1003 stop:1386 length:384 start_codon:yes stop_codon:yes gene_type:complete